MTGMNSTWVKPSRWAEAASRGASSRYVSHRLSSSGTRIHEPRCTSYTDQGACRPLARERPDIQSRSPPPYSRSHAIEAWRGGCSAYTAYGSALSAPERVIREWTRYL